MYRVGKTGKCEEGKDKVAVKDGKSNLEKQCLASVLQHSTQHPTAVLLSCSAPGVLFTAWENTENNTELCFAGLIILNVSS